MPQQKLISQRSERLTYHVLLFLNKNLFAKQFNSFMSLCLSVPLNLCHRECILFGQIQFQMQKQTNIFKVGCDKNCTKPCFRPEQQHAKKIWKKQHSHDGYKNYEKALKEIQFIDQCKETQIQVMKQEIAKNFKIIKDQIEKLEQKMIQNVVSVFYHQSSEQDSSNDHSDLSAKISSLKKRDIAQLTCRDIYLICKSLKQNCTQLKSSENLYESKVNKNKRIMIQVETQEQIKKTLSSLSLIKYEQLSNEQIRKKMDCIKEQKKEVCSKEQSLSLNSSFQISQSSSIVSKSQIQQSNVSSHISLQVSIKSESMYSYDLNSERNSTGAQSFLKDLPLFNNQNRKAVSSTDQFKKKKYVQVNARDSDDEEIQNLVRCLGQESRILDPNQIQEDPSGQDNENTKQWDQSKYTKYIRHDLSEEEQLQLAIKLSHKQTDAELQTMSQRSNKNSSSGKSQQFSYKSSKRYRLKQAQKCSSSLSHSSNTDHMKISQIHQSAEILVKQKQKFDVAIKIISILQLVMIRPIFGGIRYKMKFLGADDTGCSVFFTNFLQCIKPGIYVRLQNCFLGTYSESTNYQIQTHDKNVTILKLSSSNMVPNFTVMMSRLNHIKYKWNYDMKDNRHFKIIQILLIHKRQLMKEKLLNKNILVAILKKINRNLYIVGDYTGFIQLHIQDRFFKKSNFQAQQGDTLNIVRGIIQNQNNSFEQEQFKIHTRHERCIIHNLRHQKIKFLTDCIPYDA